ncbi:ATP-dependent RNA helicase DHX29-like [Salvelinus alpinus]
MTVQTGSSTLSSKDHRKLCLQCPLLELGRKTKENKYHESSQMSSLVETFVSQANALQRQDKAGHVRNGFCFRLYPKSRFLAFVDFSTPEILRVPWRICDFIPCSVSTAPHRSSCAEPWMRPSPSHRWKIICRWKNRRSERYRAETTYCRKHFLNRTALITIKYIKQELIRMMDQVVFSSSSKSSRGPASRDRSDPRGP